MLPESRGASCHHAVSSSKDTNPRMSNVQSSENHMTLKGPLFSRRRDSATWVEARFCHRRFQQSSCAGHRRRPPQVSSTWWPSKTQQDANPEAGRRPGCWLTDSKICPQGQVLLTFIFSGDLLEYLSTSLEQTLKMVSGSLMILGQWQKKPHVVLGPCFC